MPSRNDRGVEFWHVDQPTFHPPREVVVRMGNGVMETRKNPFPIFLRKKNRSPRYIAAEIEIASGGGPKTVAAVKKWGGAIVSDGSLPYTGFEINTAPAGGDYLIQQIEEICKALHEEEATVTSACGCHIHIDAKDFKFYDIKRLIEVYAKCEKALLAMVPRERRENHYCKPCGEHFNAAMESRALPLDTTEKPARPVQRGTVPVNFQGREYNIRYTEADRSAAMRSFNGCNGCSEHVALVIADRLRREGLPKEIVTPKHPRKISDRRRRLFEMKKARQQKRGAIKARIHGLIYPRYKGENLVNVKKGKGGGDRYVVLNLNSWFYRGSVECRLLNGSMNARKIISWGMIWQRILDYVISHSDKEVASELANKTSVECLKYIVNDPVLCDFITERHTKYGAQFLRENDNYPRNPKR